MIHTISVATMLALDMRFCIFLCVLSLGNATYGHGRVVVGAGSKNASAKNETPPEILEWMSGKARSRGLSDLAQERAMAANTMSRMDYKGVFYEGGNRSAGGCVVRVVVEDSMMTFYNAEAPARTQQVNFDAVSFHYYKTWARFRSDNGLREMCFNGISWIQGRWGSFIKQESDGNHFGMGTFVPSHDIIPGSYNAILKLVIERSASGTNFIATFHINGAEMMPRASVSVPDLTRPDTTNYFFATNAKALASWDAEHISWLVWNGVDRWLINAKTFWRNEGFISC